MNKRSNHDGYLVPQMYVYWFISSGLGWMICEVYALHCVHDEDGACWVCAMAADDNGQRFQQLYLQHLYTSRVRLIVHVDFILRV